MPSILDQQIGATYEDYKVHVTKQFSGVAGKPAVERGGAVGEKTIQ
jgi:hypothetical protein